MQFCYSSVDLTHTDMPKDPTLCPMEATECSTGLWECMSPAFNVGVIIDQVACLFTWTIRLHSATPWLMVCQCISVVLVHTVLCKYTKLQVWTWWTNGYVLVYLLILECVFLQSLK